MEVLILNFKKIDLSSFDSYNMWSKSNPSKPWKYSINKRIRRRLTFTWSVEQKQCASCKRFVHLKLHGQELGSEGGLLSNFQY